MHTSMLGPISQDVVVSSIALLCRTLVQRMMSEPQSLGMHGPESTGKVMGSHICSGAYESCVCAQPDLFPTLIANTTLCSEHLLLSCKKAAEAFIVEDRPLSADILRVAILRILGLSRDHVQTVAYTSCLRLSSEATDTHAIT
jgi:hypothetical protein